MSTSYSLPELSRTRELALNLARDWYGIPVAWLIGLISALIYVTQPAVVFPIFDDSFISLTFARNLAEHGKLSFDGVTWSTGATSPLHVFAIAALLKLGFDPINASVYVGVISHAFLTSAVYLLAWAILRNRLAGLIAAALIAFNNYAAVDAGNGLETSMFMALMTFTMATYFLGKTESWRLVTGLLGVLCVLTRPEAVFLIGALVAYRAFDRDRREPARDVVKDAVLVAAPAALAFAAYLLYGFLVSEVLGGTANAKLQLFQEYELPLMDRVAIGSDRIGFFMGPLLATLGLALLAERRREFILFGFFWLPVLVLYMAIFPGGLDHYFHRYQHPVLPLLAVLAASGVMQMIGWGMRNGTSHKFVVAAVLAVAALATEQHYERWLKHYYVPAVSETREDLAVMAQELNGILQPGDVLATHDIGAVGYYADYQVIDLVGLVNPMVLEYQEDRRVKEYLELAQPDYLLIFPEWDFHLLRIFPGEDPRFTLVREFAGGAIRTEPYLLYEINWDLPVPPPPARLAPVSQ